MTVPSSARSARAHRLAGEEVAQRVKWAYELAAADPYRAATHNKGIMNGIDARAVAHAAGARGKRAEELRRRLVARGEVKLDRARELLRALEGRP